MKNLMPPRFVNVPEAVEEGFCAEEGGTQMGVADGGVGCC